MGEAHLSFRDMLFLTVTGRRENVLNTAAKEYSFFTHQSAWLTNFSKLASQRPMLC